MEQVQLIKATMPCAQYAMHDNFCTIAHKQGCAIDTLTSTQKVHDMAILA